MAWDTAATVINTALQELAIGDEVADPYASTDATVMQLRALLKSCGRELLRLRRWTHIQKTHTLTTEADTTLYALPADFARLIDQTQWNRTQQMPLGGPVGPKSWQLLKAVASSGVVHIYHRIVAEKLEIHPTPTAGETLAYEYLSRYWVQPSGEFAPTTESPSAAADTLWFDGHLLGRMLKLRWLEAKGFPSDGARREYEDALSMASGADGAAPVLSLAGNGVTLWRPLDAANLPETGYGG